MSAQVQSGHYRNPSHASSQIDHAEMGMDFYVGDPVWMSHPTEAWIPGTIMGLDAANASLLVRSVERSHDLGDVSAVPFTADAEATLAKGPVDEGSPGRRGQRATTFKCYVLPRDHRAQAKLGVRNMDDMVHLHEGAVLDNLRKRFGHDLIYTSTGPILIAMNPFKRLPIYSQELMRDTCARIMRNWTDPEQVGCEPHVFTTVAQSYAAMKCMSPRERENQSMVICGESGAGKTETTKLMLRYLSNTASGQRKVQHGAGGGRALGIEEQILESNPLMEAFGNAKTLRNDNSSRFGKYIKVQFNEHCEIVGAQNTKYLLEK
jgi:myosin heavy subunit